MQIIVLDKQRKIKLSPKEASSRSWLLTGILCLTLLLSAGCGGSNLNSSLNLTDDEKAWLDKHRTLKIGGVPEWAPLVLLDSNNKLSGIAGNYIHILEKELGIKFEFVNIKTWHEVLESGRNKKIDVIAILGQTPDRDHYLNFTDVLVDLPYVIISRNDHKPVGKISELYGKRVSLANRYVAHEWLEREHPKINLLPGHDTAHALEDVSLGAAEVFVGDIASASYAITTLGLSNLKVAGQTSFVNHLRFGIRKDWPELAPIFNKVIQRIGDQRRQKIWNHWVHLKKEGLDPRIFIPIIIILVITVLLTLLISYSRLRKQHGSLERLVDVRVVDLARTNAFLADSEKRLSEAVINSPHPNMVHAEDGEVIMISKAWTDITGYGLKEIPTTLAWAEKAYADNAEEVYKYINTLYDLQGVKYEGEYIIITATGEERVWDFQSQSLPALTDGRRVVLSNAVDITERIRQEKLLQKELERSNMLHQLHMSAPDWSDKEIFDYVLEKGVNLTDSEIGYLHRINEDQDSISLVTWNKEALKSCTATYDSHYPLSKAGIWADSARLKKPVIHNDYEKRDDKKGYPEGHFPVNRHMSLPVLEGDMVRLIMGVGNKKTDYNDDDVEQLQVIANELLTVLKRKEAKERIDFLANHDILTQLPNRLLFKDRLMQAISYSERTNNKIAVLFLDLDNFKSINDTLGHPVGDTLLKVVATRLQSCVRTSDTISRQGGDEFLIVLSNVNTTTDITIILENIMKELSVPYQISDHELSLSVSVGISIFPEDGNEPDTLSKHADIAMYSAKDAGKNTYRFFNDQMNVEAIEIMSLRSYLKRAIEADEFLLHYQPQVDISTGRVVGVEALLRWEHPGQGLLLPDKFIAAAEDSGLIVPIGEWVLNEACREAMHWQEVGFEDVVVSVNLSAVQFKHDNLEDVIIDALAKSGLDPGLLELELTESILIQDTENVLLMVKRLKALGIRMSIDDFGTGYSSLSYLQRFAVDKLKIDKSFIQNLAESAEDVAIVRAIIQMAKTLNLKTIAEGVENKQQIRILNIQNVDEIQGFYFAKPMPPADLLEYLQDNKKTEESPVQV